MTHDDFRDITLPASSSPADCQARGAWANDLAALRADNWRTLFDALAASGIARVELGFDGVGDSGQIESITAQDAAGEAKTLAATLTVPRPVEDGVSVGELSIPVENVLEWLAYELLAETQPGWENNEGAFGTFIFDAADRTIRLEHHERIEDTLYSEHNF